MIAPKTPKPSATDEKAAYDLATERDKERCVRCGAYGIQRDHRQNRQSGNTVITNLQGLCPTCHLWKTEHPEAAIAEGFAVPRWARPEWWPAYRWGIGWVFYLTEADSFGRWWTEITESTATLLMTSGQVGTR